MSLLSSCSAGRWPATLFASSLTHVQPVVKIGLIAPFEGLYRESGYTALDALRQAIASCAPPDMAVIPLALDSSADPAQAQRAAQKMLVDPTVAAVIGPLNLDAIPAIADVMTSQVIWIAPAAVNPAGNGFANPPDTAWLTTLVTEISQREAGRRIVVVGLPPALAWQASSPATIPATVRIDEPAAALADVTSGDAIVWLGSGDGGAAWMRALHAQQPDVATSVTFWLANQMEAMVFAQHLPQNVWAALSNGTAESQEESGTLRSLIWSDAAYNQWSQQFALGTPSAYLVYRAGCAALAQLGQSTSVPSAGAQREMASWHLLEQPIVRPKATPN